jgi:hypothetical protein
VTDPSDPIAAAGRGHMRASHADREHVIDTLKAAFVQGRLTKDELDQRVGQALASKTYAELATLSADLPAGADLPTGADHPTGGDLPAGPTRPLSQPARAPGWSLGDQKVLNWAIACVLSPLAPLAAAVLTGNQAFAAVSALLFILDLVLGLPFLMIVVGTMVEERRQQRRSLGSQGQPPPGRGGRPLDGQRRGRTGHDPAQPGRHTDETRADMRAHTSCSGPPGVARSPSRRSRNSATALSPALSAAAGSSARAIISVTSLVAASTM